MTASNPGSPPAPESLLPAAWYALAARLLRRSRERWWLVGAYSLVGALVAGGTTLLLPRSFTASAAFQAEAGGGTPLSGTPFASVTGAQFTADLLTTGTVLRRVAAATYPWRGTWVPLWTVYGLDSLPEERRLRAAATRLRGALRVDVNPRTSVLTFSVEAATPELAKALADTTLATLNAASMALRHAHLAPQRARRAQLLESARRELAAADQALAGFYQQHRVLTNAPALQFEEWRLRRRVESAQDQTAQIRLQEELATVEEATPAVSVIEPPQPPDRPSGPKRRRAALAGLLIGAALALIQLALERTSRS